MLKTDERSVSVGMQTTKDINNSGKTSNIEMSTRPSNSRNANISMKSKNSRDTSIAGTPTTEAMPTTV